MASPESGESIGQELFDPLAAPGSRVAACDSFLFGTLEREADTLLQTKPEVCDFSSPVDGHLFERLAR